MIGGELSFYGVCDELPDSLLNGSVIRVHGETYVFYNNEPIRLCASPIEPEPDRMFPKICKRCGAPLKSCECEYCGTRYIW